MHCPTGIPHIGHACPRRGGGPTWDLPLWIPLSYSPFLWSPGSLFRCWFAASQGASWVKREITTLPQHHRHHKQGREKPKRQTAPDWWAAGSISKETYIEGCKTSRFPYPPTKSYKFTQKFNWAWSCTQSMWSQHCMTVSRLCPWAASRLGKASRGHISRTGREWAAAECPGPAWRPNLGSRLSDDLSQHMAMMSSNIFLHPSYFTQNDI